MLWGSCKLQEGEITSNYPKPSFEFTMFCKFSSNQRQMPFSSEGSMAVADASESDVKSLRDTVATLSAEVCGSDA